MLFAVGQGRGSTVHFPLQRLSNLSQIFLRVLLGQEERPIFRQINAFQMQQAMQQMMQPPPPNPADVLNAEKDKADLEGKALLNRQRFLDLMVQYGPSASGPAAPATAGVPPQLAGPPIGA